MEYITVNMNRNGERYLVATVLGSFVVANL